MPLPDVPARNCGFPPSGKVGVLGGSFDPVHIAHLIVAEEARVELGLDRVVFVPAGQPYLKPTGTLVAARHRLEMVRLAISSNPFFESSSVDVDRPGPSYSVDTLDALQSTFGPGMDIYFIMGWDSLVTLPLWREPSRLLNMCRVVGVPRPGVERPDVEHLGRAVPGLAQRIVLMDRPLIGVSSTEIRARLARGISVRYLVPEAVGRYIDEQGLYRDEG